MFGYGLSVGIILYFLVMRVFDIISKRAGDNCGYDCDKCTARCTGYHCYKERLAQGDSDGEISVVSSESDD